MGDSQEHEGGSKRHSMDQLNELFKGIDKSSRQRSLSDGDGNSEGGKGRCCIHAFAVVVGAGN